MDRIYFVILADGERKYVLLSTKYPRTNVLALLHGVDPVVHVGDHPCLGPRLANDMHQTLSLNDPPCHLRKRQAPPNAPPSCSCRSTTGLQCSPDRPSAACLRLSLPKVSSFSFARSLKSSQCELSYLVTPEVSKAHYYCPPPPY